MIRRQFESITGRLICLPGASTMVEINTYNNLKNSQLNYVERYSLIPKPTNFIMSNI